MITKPGNYVLHIYKGATLDRTFTWKDAIGNVIDLSGYTAEAQIRLRHGASGDPLVTLSTGNSKIVLGGTAGTIQLLMTAVATAALTFGVAVWDLELTSGAVVTRLLEGNVLVHSEVTT